MSLGKRVSPLTHGELDVAAALWPVCERCDRRYLGSSRNDEVPLDAGEAVRPRGEILRSAHGIPG